MTITSAHGGGGRLMGDLIRDIFQKRFSNEILDRMEDSAVLDIPCPKIAFTTDSFVVTPLFFPGGDIGRLAVCGTVNDLLMRGAVPGYLSAGFILEEGLEMDTLDMIACSMRAAADEAGVLIVAGDTKVIQGKGGLYINTSGIGTMETSQDISVRNARAGDAVIISGYLGNHHACILSSRMGIRNTITSDCAPLSDMVGALLASGIPVHALRDITRGGLGTVLHEIAAASGVRIEVTGELNLADVNVQGFSDILGLDPLYMGNEGKLVAFLPHSEAERALNIIRSSRYGEHAQIIGIVADGSPCAAIRTRAGGTRLIEPLAGEGLPRIC